jgi:hypothetical protein
MTPHERYLVWFLRFSAAMFLCALPFVFVPTAWMRWIADMYGLEVPDAQLVEYLTRSVSAVYAIMGTSYWFMSCDIRRYVPLLRFNAFVTIAFIVVGIGIDVMIPMPIAWTVGEAVSLIVWTALLLWLVRRVPSA